MVQALLIHNDNVRFFREWYDLPACISVLAQFRSGVPLWVEANINAIIEISKGSRNKLKFNLQDGLFELSRILLLGRHPF